MGFMSISQLFVAFSLVAAIDCVGGILSYQERARLGVLLAVMFVPLDLSVLYGVSQYTETDHPAPDYSIKQ